MNPCPPSRYCVALHRAPGCYFARVVELPGCMSRGRTEVEAVENARAAIRAHLRAVELLASEPVSLMLEISA